MTKKGLEARREDPYVSGLEERLREAVKLPAPEQPAESAGAGDNGAGGAGEEKKEEKKEGVRFVAMYDVAKAYKFHTGTVPPHYEMGKELLKELERAAVETMKAFVAPENQSEMLALSIGKVVEDLLAGMRQVAEGPGPGAGVGQKMQLYSGHDTTLMPLLVALGYKLEEWPPFMSNLIFELYWSEARRTHVVKIYFNRELLRVADLAELEQALKPLVLENYRGKCDEPLVARRSEKQSRLTGVSNGVE